MVMDRPFISSMRVTEQNSKWSLQSSNSNHESYPTWYESDFGIELLGIVFSSSSATGTTHNVVGRATNVDDRRRHRYHHQRLYWKN
mmetsp:Transcript_38908/g.81386  ORF Transcript_38908/g.81386 Transcript_38908/m.81386 type:complete len:86 (+) Transcript_38908:400-657(+)